MLYLTNDFRSGLQANGSIFASKPGTLRSYGNPKSR